MTVMLYTGSRDEFKANYDEALKLAPGSVETRLAYIRGLEPRWGGSYAQMEAFAAESRSALAPKDAGRLTARIHAHRGFESDRERDFKQALVHYDAAITLDPDAELICRRASSLSSLNRPGEAFVEVGRALAKTPDNRYCAEMAAYLAPRVDDPAEVVRVLSAVIDVDPSYVAAYNQRGWSYQRQGKLDQAFPDYLAAAKLGDAWAQRQVGKLYWSGTGVNQDRQEAVAWLEKAAKQGNAEARADLDEARKAQGRASP
jgi:TPR repeat protein